MFAYIDPTIRTRLREAGQLYRIDGRGGKIDADAVSDETDVTLNVLGIVPLPIDVAGRLITFDWYTFVRHTELAHAEEIGCAVRRREDHRLFPLLSTHMAVNSALVYGDLAGTENPLVRVHSCCMTGDVFGSRRCDCGPQFRSALERITSDEGGAGALIYMAGHEGRGIGLWAKAITYLLQDAGHDTYQANEALGLPADSRNFGDAAAMLAHLLGGNRPFRLMSNNPKKRADLEACGLDQFTVAKHVVGVNDANRRYLRAKKEWGHSIEDEDIAPKS
jgi:GTP cyclohydrolase II